MDFVINLENAGGGRGVYLIGGFKNWTIRVDDPGVAEVDELGEMLAIEVAPKFESSSASGHNKVLLSDTMLLSMQIRPSRDSLLSLYHRLCDLSR